MATLTLNGPSPAESYVTAYRGADLVRRGFRWKSSPNILAVADTYPVFNLTSDSVNGVAFRTMNDDAPPCQINGSHLGANHAIVGGRITHVGHGKTSADIGSVWQLGSDQFVLIRTLGTNQVLLAQIGTSVVPPVGAYTHVSGAVNTTDIVASASVSQPFYPMISNYSLRVDVDGSEISTDTGSWTYSRNVAFLETYDVMARDDVLAWFVSNGNAGGMALTGPKLFSVSNTYVFDLDANLTIYHEFLARKPLMLNAIYGVQVQLSGATHFYLPKTIPFTHDGSVRDFSLIETAVAPSTQINFDGTNTIGTGLYLDRFFSMNATVALATGFAPMQDEEPANRRSIVTGTGFHIATSGKAYMRAADQGGYAMAAGERYGFTAYRNIVIRNADRTTSHVVRTNEADFLYADWHDTAKSDRVPVPSDLVGRPFTVVEKSENTTVGSGRLNGAVIVDVSAAGGYGYLVLKVDR